MFPVVSVAGAAQQHVRLYWTMTQSYLITGRIIPERKQFSHDGLRLFAKDDISKINTTIIFGVVDNQYTAQIIGDIGEQSNVMLKDMAAQSENIVLSAYAFVKGIVFDVDIIGIIRKPEGKSDGSIDYHYMDNIHDVITNRESSINLQDIWNVCISEEGTSLVRCLNDLKMALKEINETPFYCYRAIETIKFHLGTHYGEEKDKKQWEITREVLAIEEKDLYSIKDLADPIRHGKSIHYRGKQWRDVIRIAWDITEKYIQFLKEILDGKKQWPNIKA
jgi:hypothetical protein